MTLSDSPASPGERKPKPLGRLVRLCLVLAAISVLVLAGPRIWQSVHQQTGPPVPEVDLKISPPRVREAIGQAQQAVRDDPQDGPAWGKLGMVLLAHQFDLESQICFEQAASLDADEVRWPYLHGLAVLAFDREAAVRSFRRALERDPQSGVIHNRLGEVLLELGRLEEAEESLLAAHRIQPEETRPCIALARLEIARGRFDAAFEWATKAAQRDPERRLIRELLANIHNRRGDHEAALREMERAGSLPEQPLLWNDPFAEEVHALREDAEKQFEIARTLLEQNRSSEAISLMQEALQNDDRDPQNFCRLGQTLMELGRLDEAAQVLARGQTRHPDSIRIRFQRGVLLFRIEDFQSAANLFREAVELKPDYAAAQFNLGQTLERLDDLPGALEAFESAARCRPADAKAHREAGRLLLGLGRTSEAQSQLELAVRLDPEDEKSSSLLERARTASRPETPE